MKFKENIQYITSNYPFVIVGMNTMHGFPTETEQDHQDTLSLMEYVKYNFGYMFTYSERPGTLAERKLEDDIPEDVKSRRLAEIIELQLKHSAFRTQQFLNTTVEVLIEKESKKSNQHWSGRTEHNIVAVFPKGNYNVGDFVNVKITDCTKATLIGDGVGLSKNN